VGWEFGVGCTDGAIRGVGELEAVRWWMIQKREVIVQCLFLYG